MIKPLLHRDKHSKTCQNSSNGSPGALITVGVVRCILLWSWNKGSPLLGPKCSNTTIYIYIYSNAIKHDSSFLAICHWGHCSPFRGARFALHRRHGASITILRSGSTDLFGKKKPQCKSCKKSISKPTPGINSPACMQMGHHSMYCQFLARYLYLYVCVNLNKHPL